MSMKNGLMALGLGLGITFVTAVLLCGASDQTVLAQSGSGVIRVATAGVDGPGCGSVASPCRTVQFAVDQALPGEEVWVAQGVYTGVQNVPSLNTGQFTATQLVVITKSITLRGGYSAAFDAWSPADHQTVLNAQGKGRVVYIAGTIAPMIEGLRITGGDSTGLGGSTYDFDGGGGLYVLQGSALISGNQVYGNTGYRGGGMWLQYSNATLRDNVLDNNTAGWAGGALWLNGSPATLEGNTVVSCTAPYAGGIALLQSDATLKGNHVFRNSASSSEGGGIAVTLGEPILDSNLIVSNSVGFKGGGVAIYFSEARLYNNVIADNHADSLGSGVYAEASSARLFHNTIARNTGGGGGLYSGSTAYGATSHVLMTNTIVSGHSEGVVAGEGSTATLRATLWHDNTADTAGAGAVFIGTTNVYGDPSFAADGYHLRGGSAAVDAGVDAGVSADIDGDARPLGAGFDIGADEHVPRVYLPLVVRAQ